MPFTHLHTHRYDFSPWRVGARIHISELSCYILAGIHGLATSASQLGDVVEQLIVRAPEAERFFDV